jgi:hypothetical protein
LEEKKEAEEKSKEMEEQLKAVYYTYPIILEEEKPENVKKYINELSERIEELEKRPTQEDLDKAIQKEANKYKDYVKLTSQEQEAINNYLKVKNGLEAAEKKLTETSGPTLSEEEIKKLQTYDILKIELEQLKAVQSKLNQPRETENSAKQNEEIIKKIGELLTAAIDPLRLEIAKLLEKQSTNNIQPNNSLAELPTNYEELKLEKEELFRILEIFKLKIPENEEKV